MGAYIDGSPLRIAVSFGALSPQLAPLLNRQRAEEPQTPLELHEVTLAEQCRGIEEGRYDGGLALTCAHGYALKAQPLWRDELAVALPERSPLLALSSVPLEALAHYPLIRWCEQTCAPLSPLVDFLVGKDSDPERSACVENFELMALLVAAGFGVGLGARSVIAASRRRSIVMRPLAGTRHELTTYLLRPDAGAPAKVDRLAERAKTLATEGAYPRSSAP